MIPTQNTPEWRAWRKNKIGASDAPIIMGISPWMTPLQLLEEKLGFRPEKNLSYAMARGIELENSARQEYEKISGNFVYPIVVISHEFDWCIASLDGITLDNKCIVEIKVPGKKTIEMAENGIIPEHYKCQMYHQMFVTGLDSCDYFCYDGKQGYLICLKKDEEFIDKMIMAELEFMECLKNSALVGL
jgi:putative phage-type endonuclease